MLEQETGEGRGDATEKAVRDRYAAGAKAREVALCCPVQYDTSLLEAIPQEVIERDYGCGDPTKHLRAGETVLDLGSGTGKACFMASQVVGPEGRVIGVDMTDDMLEVARRNAPIVAESIGHANVEFRKGKIQDLRLDREQLGAWLAENPVKDEEGLQALESKTAELGESSPMIADDSIDVVVSNCVLNLVKPEDKDQMFEELFRVLKPGGRAVISDIVCDEDVPEDMQRDPELWSGCISGAYREDLFLEAFDEAGFHGLQVLERQKDVWQTVEGIEFRSLTVEAYKPVPGEGLDLLQAVVYKGPFAAVQDDEGRVHPRGVRSAVSSRTFDRLSAAPYDGHFDAVEPLNAVPAGSAESFPCGGGERVRSPQESKGEGYKDTKAGGSDCCAPADDANSGCC
jgi:arsenite methyltransferase